MGGIYKTAHTLKDGDVVFIHQIVDAFGGLFYHTAFAAHHLLEVDLNFSVYINPVGGKMLDSIFVMVRRI